MLNDDSTMKITVEMLKENRACKAQLAIFEKEWPDGVELTRDAVLRALELNLDLDWTAGMLLTDLVYRRWETAFNQAYYKRLGIETELIVTYETEDDAAWQEFFEKPYEERNIGKREDRHSQAIGIYRAGCAEAMRIWRDETADAFMAAVKEAGL
jgi:hypothetical protein